MQFCTSAASAEGNERHHLLFFEHSFYLSANYFSQGRAHFLLTDILPAMESCGLAAPYPYARNTSNRSKRKMAHDLACTYLYAEECALIPRTCVSAKQPVSTFFGRGVGSHVQMCSPYMPRYSCVVGRVALHHSTARNQKCTAGKSCTIRYL